MLTEEDIIDLPSSSTRRCLQRILALLQGPQAGPSFWPSESLAAEERTPYIKRQSVTES